MQNWVWWLHLFNNISTQCLNENINHSSENILKEKLLLYLLIETWKFSLIATFVKLKSIPRTIR